MNENRQWLLRKKPETMVYAEHLELTVKPVAEPGPGEVLIKIIYLSLDPGQLFYMSSSDDVGGGTMRLGDVVRAWGVGRVVASNSEGFPVGSYARDRYGFAGMQEYTILPEAQLYRVDPDFAPLSAQIGVLGMPGLTAYLGLIEIGRPQAGETVVVSGAAGAVGAVVGQLAKATGGRAVGIAGGPEKCRQVVEELGFDTCVDYKSDDFAASLAAACPNGINVYFDNVAGKILDTCLSLMAFRGRIVSCGMIAEYAEQGGWTGLSNYTNVLIQSLRWEGLSIHNYYNRYDAVYAALEDYYRQRKLTSREDIAVGLENFIPVFHRLFAGANRGKLVLQVRDGETR